MNADNIDDYNFEELNFDDFNFIDFNFENVMPRDNEEKPNLFGSAFLIYENIPKGTIILQNLWIII